MIDKHNYIIELQLPEGTSYVRIEPAKLIPSWPVTVFVACKDAANIFEERKDAEKIMAQLGVYDPRLVAVPKA